MWVVFFLIVYFVNSYEVPQTVMDVALYEIKYYYIIIKLMISCRSQ